MGGIVLNNVRKSYAGGPQVLHGIDMSISPGEFVVIVGPSGCGKSTLLRLVAGLESCSGGDIVIGGMHANGLAPQDRDIAMIFQNYALYPHMTVRQNIAFGLELRGMARRERNKRADEVARTLQLTPFLDRKPGALSGGQRQRVAMGRAMARDCSTFLMDEPLSNLDNALRVTMRTEIKQLHRQLGATILYVTHDQTEALSLADRVAVFRDGHLLQFDTPEAIYDRPAHSFVAGFLGAPKINFVPGDKLAGLADGRGIVAGFRPEALVAHDKEPSGLAWPARASLMEMTGAEAVIHCETAVGPITLSMPRKHLPTDPERFWIGYELADALLFDAASGRALRNHAA